MLTASSSTGGGEQRFCKPGVCLLRLLAQARALGFSFFLQSGLSCHPYRSVLSPFQVKRTLFINGISKYAEPEKIKKHFE